MNLNQLLVRAARSFPDRIAISHGTADYCDYATLARRAAGLAGAMRGPLGLSENDRIGLFMTNTPEYLEAFHGALHAGMTALPINNKLHEKELAYILDDARAGVLIVTPDLAEKAAKGLEIAGSKARIVVVGDKNYIGYRESEPLAMTERGDDDLAWLFYTSGTTGNPKGAMLSHRNLWENDADLFPRCGPGAGQWCCITSRAHVTWLRVLWNSPSCDRRMSGGSRIWRFRAR